MGRKEDNIKKAQALVHQKDRIRNIGTAAHIDHGKCVSGDTRLWVDGRWIRAEELWRRFESGTPIPNSLGADVRDTIHASLWTRSLELTSGNTSFAQISHVWRLRAMEPLIELETRDGRRIRTTREHRFAVAKGQRLGYEEAAGMRPGTVLVVPRRLPSRDDTRGWDVLETAILRRLVADSRFLFEATPDGERRLGIRGRVDGANLVATAETARISMEQLYVLIQKVTYHAREGSKLASPMHLPQRATLERTFRYFGLLYGGAEGHLHGADGRVLEEAHAALQGLVARPAATRPPSRVSRLGPQSKSLRMFLRVVMGYPTRRKARTMRLPDLLHLAPLSLAAAFVQGYLDAHGTVERGRGGVSVTSASEEFLDDLQLLLLRFGVRAILDRGGSCATLHIADRKDLQSLLRFRRPGKLERHRKLDRSAGPSHVVDLVPVERSERSSPTGRTRGYSRLGQEPSAELLLSTIGSDLVRGEPVLSEDVAFVEVRSVSHVTEEWVYDFSVPGPRNFVAEGMLVHKTNQSY